MRFSSFDTLLTHQAEALGEKPALLWEDRTLSYRALKHEVDGRALALAGEGKTCLGVFCDGSLACVIEIFAAVQAGMQVVLLDENTPDEALEGLITYTDLDALWGDEALVEQCRPYLTPGVRDGAGKLLFFTSGTTQAAKAVVLTDHSLCQSAYNGASKLPLAPEDRLICLLPLNHVFGFVCGLLWGLQCGCTVALGRGARHYWDDLAHYEPTAAAMVPALLGFYLKRGGFNPALRLVLIGAGDCPPQLLRRAEELGLRVSFGYGLTETSSGVAISTSGNPFALELCPDDQITIAADGEILITAPTCMMQGYYKKESDTAAVLKDGVLSTGDLGWLDEAGRLHVTGRKKEILVLPDGTKLYLPEYEHQIAQALGEGELALVLRGGRPVLVLPGQARDKQELLRALYPVTCQKPRGQQLGDILFWGGPLPRTATGKIQRWEIQQKAEEL